MRMTLLLALVAITSAPLTRASAATRDIAWTNGDVSIAATLYLPDSPGPHPLAVFIPGSGCLTRAEPPIRAHASRLAALGLATLVYDKRGCGDSTGDWREVGFDELADDLAAGIRAVCATPDIDPTRVVTFGLSQGAWISLIAADAGAPITHIVLLSGPPMTPAEQGHAIVEMRMRRAGWPEEDVRKAVALDRAVTEVYRTDAGWDAARAAIEAVADEPWFADAGVGVQDHESWNWRWLRRFLDYDPLPSLERLTQPVLAIYGSEDEIVPAHRSVEIVETLAARAAGPRAVTLLDGVGHTLTPGRGRPWPDAYWSTIEEWLVQHGALPGAAPAD